MTMQHSIAAASKPLAAPENASPTLEYLAFTLGQEEYGIDIQKVQELRGYEAVTRIANAPAFLKGVVNLRGLIVPIVDMRIRFGLGTPGYDQFTVVIILNLADRRVMGMVVDSVSDVVTLTPGQIKAAPDIGGERELAYVTGLAVLDERMLILTDVEQLVSSSELGCVADAVA